MQEIKYTLDGISVRLDIVDKMISELEDIKIKTIQNKMEKVSSKKKKQKNKQTIN